MRLLAVSAAIGLIVLTVNISLTAEVPEGHSVSLADTVREFNAKAAANTIGK